MGETYWLDTFLTSYNIVKLMAILFILGQGIALRDKNAKLSLHIQYAFIASFILVYALNYILFKLVGTTTLFSTLLLELVITAGVFTYPIMRFIDQKKKEVQQ